MQDLAPIVLFVYNRKWHTEQTINALRMNKLATDSELFIFSDGAKSEKDEVRVMEVRELVKNIGGFKSVTLKENKQNLGLANSVIYGVTEVFKHFDKAIIMEDDIISSENFLTFMNSALNFYSNEIRIFSVSGYTFPVEIPSSYRHEIFISYRSSSWGWGTWRDRWEKVDWNVSDYIEFKKDKKAQKLFNRGGEDLTPMLYDQMKGKLDSWAVRWAYAQYKNDAFCLYPVKSKISNIGTDNSGTHSDRTKKFQIELDMDGTETKFINNIQIDKGIVAGFKNFSRRTILRKILDYIKLKRW